MKKGTIVVEAEKPLRFEVSEESDTPPTPEQANSNLIADALKAYCKSARDLVAGEISVSCRCCASRRSRTTSWSGTAQQGLSVRRPKSSGREPS